MRRGFRFLHWLKLTFSWAAAFVLIVVASALIVAQRLPPLNIAPLAISFGPLIGTLQYRRDLALAVSESLTPWLLSVGSMAALLFWSLSIKQPTVGTRLALAVGLGLAISLICLFPLRWVISSFGASRYAP
jgi:hypothetical protein